MRGILWAVAILALTVLSYKHFFVASGGLLTDQEAMDFAQIARNMALGHGYATSVLRPLAIIGFAPPDASGVAPDVSHAPLYPFLLMLVALIHGRGLGDNTVVVTSLFLFLCSVLAVYRLARTLFPAPEQAGIALLSVGLYGIGSEMLGNALLGLPVTLATLAVTLLLIAMHRATETAGRRAGPGSALVVGLLLGLCYLTQYSLLLLAVPALVYLFFTRAPERSWAAIGACTLGFFAITGTWLVRNAHISHGNPFFTLLFYSIMNNTDAYPGYTTVYRSAVPPSSLLVYFFSHLPEMLARVGRGLTLYRDTLLQAFNVFLLAAAVASLLWRASDTRLSALRWFAAFCLLEIVVVTSLFDPNAQIIAPFAPLITVVAVGFVFSLVAEQNWEPFWQRTTVWSLALLVILGAVVQFAGKKPVPADPISGAVQALSGLGLRPNQAVISDVPWELTWRTGLPVIWLPAENETYQGTVSLTSQVNVPISAMVLTPNMGSYDLAGQEIASWWHLQTYSGTYLQAIEPLNQQAVQIDAAVADHDPRVTPAILQFRKSIPDYEKRLYGQYQQQVATLTDISSVTADFSPYKYAAEADGVSSNLFLHR